MHLNQLETTRIANRYATALLDLAYKDGEDTPQQIAAQLQSLALAIDAEQLQNAAQVVTPQAMKSFWQSIGKAMACHPLITKTLHVMAEARRSHLLAQLYSLYRDQLDKRRGRIHVHVISAEDMSAQDIKAMEAQISSIALQDNISLSHECDPQILGGLILEIGSRRIDDSVRGQLELLRRNLLSNAH